MHFQAYPWALAPAFDLSLTDMQRRDTLQRFFRVGECCLDLGLGRQLRKAFTTIDAYWGTPLADFLTTVFARVVVTSTQVELQFSLYTGLADTRNKRLGLSGLAAKAMNNGFAEIVEDWREDENMGRVKQSTGRARPV